jgi:U6 snRNA-associated Sm-like protein LSm8
VLKGFDQCVNVILDDSFERVFSLKEPVEAVELGLYIVRGDNMCEMLNVLLNGKM